MTRVRVNADNSPASPGLNADSDFAEFLLGNASSGAASYATSANPTAEVVSTAVSANISANASKFGPTLAAAAGTITIARPGTYLVYVNIADADPASASGVMTFEVQKGGAALSPRLRAKAIATATGVFSLNLSAMRIVTLAGGDVLRLVVTGTTGGVISIVDGSWGVVQLTDQATTHE
jgi:hypothetical protein